MTTEEKARAYAEKAYYPAPEYGWYESDHEAMTDVLEQAYLAGATEALASQWKDPKVELPEEVTIDGWVARDDEDVIGERSLYLYPMKPFRKEHWFALPKDTVYNAAMRLDVGLFPNLTFENPPMEVTITIKPKKKQ